MPRERTLLERLGNPQTNAPRTTKENTDQLAESVLTHLQKMLNTRQGHVLILSDYGIPDLSEVVHSFPDSIKQMQEAIRTSIEKYEPRLRKVRVRHVGSGEDILKLRFEITAQLVTAQEKASVWFETMVNSSGQVEIKG
ncbi:MAG: type VI secretion system baseplate subunit TssE [bacterium]|nr:type VI secretion system baseplate subunit TssE [bacterium]